MRDAVQEDILGPFTPDEPCRRELAICDVPFQIMESEKRTTVEERVQRSSKHMAPVRIEVPLIPKTRRITTPAQLRPISLVPLLRILLGSIMLEKVRPYIQEASWQFAYRSQHQVLDVIVMIMIFGQKAMEWKRPFYMAIGDIAKCFMMADNS